MFGEFLCTYQENNRDVQGESDESVDEEGGVTDRLDLRPGHLGDLDDQAGDAVHDGAGGSEVVEGDERVHLELGGGEELLHHDEASGLESDTRKLEQEADHHELDLAVGGDDHTEDDEGDVAERLQVGRRDAHDPGCDENGDWSGGLGRSVSALLEGF